MASLPPNVHLVGFVDIDLEAARHLAEGSSAIVDDDLTAVLRSARPDAVFDCTTPEAHPAVTITALAAGCHVLGEKPMAPSMDDARRMVLAAEQAGRIYAVSQNRRYGPEVRRLRRMLPELGSLTSVHTDFFIGAHFGGFRDLMHHPLLVDMAIHTFDLARAMTGADAVAALHGGTLALLVRRPSSAVCVFEMTGGLVFTYRGSWSAEGEHTGWIGEWRFIGERGSMIWDGESAPRGQVVAGRGPSDLHSPFDPIPVPTDEEAGPGEVGPLAEFVHAVETGRRPQTMCTDNIKSLAMVIAAIDSAGTKTRVGLPDVAGGSSPPTP
jgi:predicted dehydrogenase